MLLQSSLEVIPRIMTLKFRERFGMMFLNFRHTRYKT